MIKYVLKEIGTGLLVAVGINLPFWLYFAGVI